jgi:hypothetical protein
MWIVVNIGCIECGVSTQIVGVFDSEEKANAIVQDLSQRFSWREGGQNDFEAFPMPEVNVINPEYLGEDAPKVYDQGLGVSVGEGGVAQLLQSSATSTSKIVAKYTEVLENKNEEDRVMSSQDISTSDQVSVREFTLSKEATEALRVNVTLEDLGEVK